MVELASTSDDHSDRLAELAPGRVAWFPAGLLRVRQAWGMSTDEAASAVTALADDVARAWFDADPLRASLLGVHDRAGELADLYGQGTDWAQQVALDVAPAIEEDSQALADAAFWLYLRGATDFAGGRKLEV